jgi:hypothetical protein
VTLAAAARFVGQMKPFRQARRHWDFAAELLRRLRRREKRKTYKPQRCRWNARCGLTGGCDAPRQRDHIPRHSRQAGRAAHHL